LIEHWLLVPIILASDKPEALLYSINGENALKPIGVPSTGFSDSAEPEIEGGEVKATQWFALCPVLLMAASLCWAEQSNRASSLQLDFVWKQSLPLRSGDPRITAIGGTELRALATFDTKLFAAVGYWMDTATTSPALPRSPGAAFGRCQRAVAGRS
jgi:hypothetical protein